MLQARGITGIILAARLPLPGPIMELNWGKFTVVALGYSITNIRPHRVCYHQFQSMRLNLTELRKRGYRRIGLAIHENLDVRSNGLFLGAFLTEQCHWPAKEQVPSLIEPGLRLDAGKFLAWIRRVKPDCVITAEGAALGWLRAAGLRECRLISDCPRSAWRRAMALSPASMSSAVNCWSEAAIDLTSALLRSERNEEGYRSILRYSLVEARWIDGPTVRSMPA